MSALPLPLSRPALEIRSASLADVPGLEALMAPFVATGDLLPRSNYDLCRHIKEYVVAVTADGEVIGCGSLKVYSQTLGEVAGLAVADGWQGAGVGRAIVAGLLEDALALGLAETFALTRKPDFFSRLGFDRTEKTRFPLKVWADCARCPRQSCCDEIAVTRLLA
ncbi:MAG TPA: GNAT family N-acetyltransferase [Gemmatimonadales bacterium]|nr:GNAT family N-acetyltransferase [Gemmatimonadales bacterium]